MVDMTLLEQIQQQLSQLPPEKQREVLDFAAFLRSQMTQPQPINPGSLQKHPAFGAWRARRIDALQYQENLRAEWDSGIEVVIYSEDLECL
jgi:hypothetical protein